MAQQFLIHKLSELGAIEVLEFVPTRPYPSLREVLVHVSGERPPGVGAELIQPWYSNVKA